jgi:hypothetical protein
MSAETVGCRKCVYPDVIADSHGFMDNALSDANQKKSNRKQASTYLT